MALYCICGILFCQAGSEFLSLVRINLKLQRYYTKLELQRDALQRSIGHVTALLGVQPTKLLTQSSYRTAHYAKCTESKPENRMLQPQLFLSIPSIQLPSSLVCNITHLANSPKYDHYNNIPNTIPLCDWLNHTILATITRNVSWGWGQTAELRIWYSIAQRDGSTSTTTCFTLWIRNRQIKEAVE